MRFALFFGMVVLLVSPVFAAYQGEVTGGFGEREYDESRLDLSSRSASVRYFLSPVKAEETPIRLAPFMERQSLLMAEWQSLELDHAPSGAEREAVSLAGDFQLGDTPFRLGAGVTRWDYGGERLREDSLNFDWYYQRHGAVSLLGSRWNNNDDINEEDAAEVGLAIAQVVTLGNSHLYLFGRYKRYESVIPVFPGGEYVDRVTRSRFLMASWYPRRDFGVGISYGEEVSEYDTPYDPNVGYSGYLVFIQFDPAEDFGVSLSAGPGNEETTNYRIDSMGNITGVRRIDFDYDDLNASVTWRF